MTNIQTESVQTPRFPDLAKWLPVLAAVVSVIVRIPFLLKGEAFFNSDEGVEGLMARHIAEWPVFFWGQGYKGVPEAYLAAVVFATFGVGVVQLKAVTLGIWAGAVAVSTRLAQRWYGDRAGVIAGALFAFAPVSVVYWSLSASAEVAWLTLIFSTVLLAYQRAVDQPGSPVNPVVPIGCGAALFVHPIAVGFVGALALTAALRSRWWQQHGWIGIGELLTGRHVGGVMRAAIVIVNLLVACLLATFLLTYLGGRLDLGMLTSSHPQKVFRQLAIAGALAIGVHGFAGAIVPRRRVGAALGWFALGLFPVWLYVARGGVPGSIISVHSIADAPALVRVFAVEALPMLLGMRDFNGGPLGVWWLTVPFVFLLAVHVAATSREWAGAFVGGPAPRPSATFAVYAAGGLLCMLGPGGAFNDVLSYRYVMPYFGLMVISAASGVRLLGSRSRAAAALVVTACLGASIFTSTRWYSILRAGDDDHQVIRCLVASGVRAATADYWIAYRMTFMADERVVVNPDFQARYLPYAEAAGAAPPVWIQYTDRPEAEPKRGPVICKSGALEAITPAARP